MPAGGGRPVIVFYHEGRIGYFTHRPGETLSRVDGLPSRNILPGYQRADRRLARLVASERLRDVGESYVWPPGYDG